MQKQFETACRQLRMKTEIALYKILFIDCNDIPVLYALYTAVGSRPMRCFPKLNSWYCFVRLLYEVIIVY